MSANSSTSDSLFARAQKLIPGGVNELRVIRHRVGYLINFGAVPRLQWSRRLL